MRGDGGIELVERSGNFGSAKARNIGVAKATGDYNLTFDSDAVLPRGAVRDLVARMEAEPDVGIMGCRILNYYTRDIDQWINPHRYEDHGDRAFDTYSFWACGAIARADALQRVGGFWDDLFIYNEELDLSIRLIQAGYRVTYCPDVCVYHQTSPNGREAKGNCYYLMTRNYMRIFYRYFPSRYRRGMALKDAALYVAKGLCAGRIASCLRGIWVGLRERKAIKSQFSQHLTDSQVLYLFNLNPRFRGQPSTALADVWRAIRWFMF